MERVISQADDAALFNDGCTHNGAKNVSKVCTDELSVVTGADGQDVEGESVKKAAGVDECFAGKMLELAEQKDVRVERKKVKPDDFR